MGLTYSVFERKHGYPLLLFETGNIGATGIVHLYGIPTNVLLFISFINRCSMNYEEF